MLQWKGHVVNTECTCCISSLILVHYILNKIFFLNEIIKAISTACRFVWSSKYFLSALLEEQERERTITEGMIHVSS